MVQHQSQLVVIADSEHARFVRPGEAGALHSDAAFDSVTAHQRSSDIGTGRPGESSHSDSPGHHGLAPRHDLHALAKQDFAQSVARRLNEGSSRGEFDTLVLVAPAHALNTIREALDTATRARVVGTLAKDLVKTPDAELWPHLRAWVRPVHRPAG